MKYYGATHMADSFRTVRKNTLQVAADIPDDRYGFVPADGARSVSELLAHIALSPKLQLTFHDGGRRSSFEGLDLFAILTAAAKEEARDRTKAEIMDLLRTEGETWASFLTAASEEFLAQPFTVPPGATPSSKTRFDMLLSVKEHEMHHRGQLMVVQRLLGIEPHLTAQRRRAGQAAKEAAGS